MKGIFTGVFYLVVCLGLGACSKMEVASDLSSSSRADQFCDSDSQSCQCIPGKIIFNEAGSYDFQVPPNCQTIVVKVWGAGGGAGGISTELGGTGGGGAYIHSSLSVRPNEKLEIIVASGGKAGVGDPTQASGGGGGGASAIARGAIPLLIAAGGAGGGGGGTSAGSAGGPAGISNGLDGQVASDATQGGGGLQDQGGSGGSGGGGSGSDGVDGNGGSGGTNLAQTPLGGDPGEGISIGGPGGSGNIAGGGGGGAGYFGGGGGGRALTGGAGGGGGSSLLSGEVITSETGQDRFAGGEDDEDYEELSGRGGLSVIGTLPDGRDISQSLDGTSGLIVISW